MNTLPARLPPRYDVLGVGVSAVDMEASVRFLLDAAAAGASGYVCVTGVHGVMESGRDTDLLRIHNASLLTVPDGMPLVWIARFRGMAGVGRVYGPDLMRRILRATGAGPMSTRAAASHFFLGSTPDTLDVLSERIAAGFPGVRIAGEWSPPFGAWSESDWDEALDRVRHSGADWIWVGMSTPKQERFMSEFLRRWRAGVAEEAPAAAAAARPAGRPLLLLGVGAAFDILAGRRADAPAWMKRAGLQWLHRLGQEPRRLGPRYAWIVPAFLWRCAVAASRRRGQ